MDERDHFDIDLRRSIILGSYVRHWGSPRDRFVAHRGDHLAEVYSFPTAGKTRVHRFATVGVSAGLREDGRPAAWELFMALPESLAGATVQEIASFMFDVMTYSFRSDVSFDVGQAIPETPLAPKAWKPRALLLDEPRGEALDLTTFHVGIQHVRLMWLLPIFQDEYNLVKKKGLRAFYSLEGDSDWSLADPERPSLVSTAT